MSFKRNLQLENYFKILPKQDYLILFRYRTANHRLSIETGRYDRTILENRKCERCSLDKVGSEKHNQLECTYFAETRSKYIATTHQNQDTFLQH